jgi:hypothetical protein
LSNANSCGREGAKRHEGPGAPKADAVLADVRCGGRFSERADRVKKERGRGKREKRKTKKTKKGPAPELNWTLAHPKGESYR